MPPRPAFPILGLIAISVTLVSWAGSLVATSIALREMEALPLAAVRFAAASLIAAAWLATKRPRRLSPSYYGYVMLCGFGFAASIGFLNIGQLTVSGGAASFLISTQTLFIPMLSVLFFKETFLRWAWVGAIVGLLGVGVISWGQPGGLAFGAGSMLVLVSSFAAAVFSAFQRPLLTRLDPLSVTAIIIITAALFLTPWLPQGLRQASGASLITHICIAILAIAPTALGQSCWTYSIHVFGPARAGQFLYLLPLVATALTWGIVGDAPRVSTLVGGVVVLLGVLIVNTWGRNRQPPVQA